MENLYSRDAAIAVSELTSSGRHPEISMYIWGFSPDDARSQVPPNRPTLLGGLHLEYSCYNIFMPPNKKTAQKSPVIDIPLLPSCEGDNHAWVWLGKSSLDASSPPDDFLCRCGKVKWMDRNPI